MTHPKEGKGLTRRQLLRGAAVAAAGTGVAGVLAACQNTTTPIGFCEEGAGGGGLTSQLVVPKPAGPGGLPLPRNDNSVEWKILEDNPPIKDGLDVEGGTLQLFNYADYIDPTTVKKFEKEFGASVKIGTYNSSDEAIAKLSSGQVDYDVVLGLSADVIVKLMAKQVVQPLNHTYLPNLKNIWPPLADPFYDKGSHYTVPYVVWADGIGWRNDKVSEDIAGMDVPWDIFWHSQAYKGKVGLLDDKRDALSMPMQRSAMHEGRLADVNTEDPEIIANAGKELEQLTSIANIKVTITDYQTLPEGKMWLHHSWSGDLIAASLPGFYLPEGTPPTVLSFWRPSGGGVVQNDYFFIARGAKKPALAHAFLNFMLDEKNAYDNMINFVGYIPPQNGITADSLIDGGVIPKTLETAVLGPADFPVNSALLALTVEGERLWETAWTKFRSG